MLALAQGQGMLLQHTNIQHRHTTQLWPAIAQPIIYVTTNFNQKWTAGRPLISSYNRHPSKHNVMQYH